MVVPKGFVQVEREKWISETDKWQEEKMDTRTPWCGPHRTHAQK